MNRRLLHFPVRRSFPSPLTEGSLARDPQTNGQRIAEQVDGELARKAGRIAKGRHIEFDKARNRLMAERSGSWLQRLVSFFRGVSFFRQR